MAGSGGAAAGALAALIAAGARVRLVARRPGVAQGLRRRFSARERGAHRRHRWHGRRPGAGAGGRDGADLGRTGGGLARSGTAAEGLDRLERSTAVLEMAYGDSTPLGRLSRAHTSRYQDGLPMLVHQAARAVELVTGRLPPAAPLLKAARTAPAAA